MEAKELRIGNYVSVQDKPIKIESINNTGINCEVSGGYYIGDFETDYDGYFENWGTHFSDKCVYPIKLTEEMLIKLGFKHTLIFGWQREDCPYIEFNKEKKRFEFTDYVLSGIDIQYVHLLQNAVYMLEKTELTFA